MNKPIFLIGMPGSGKTTQGRALARKLDMQFYDLDFCIEQRYRCKISSIFREKGEAEFRRMESKMLREIGEYENVVISCGGGTPCRQENIDYMNRRGITIWLCATPEQIMERVGKNPDKRPLFSDMDLVQLRLKIEKTLCERETFYRQAQLHIAADGNRHFHENDEYIEKIKGMNP